jgi:hypothetical protein
VNQELTQVSIVNAQLPERYEAAKNALAECSRIDECKDWADKAIALASYARQSQDDQLEKLAFRIKSRAIRRARELMKQFQVKSGIGRPKKVNGGGNAPISQRQAAAAAGFSKDQEKYAKRIGDIPEEDFERAIESDNPRQAISEILTSDKPSGFKDATQAMGALKEFALFCKQHDPGEIAGGVLPQEPRASV